MIRMLFFDFLIFLETKSPELGIGPLAAAVRNPAKWMPRPGLPFPDGPADTTDLSHLSSCAGAAPPIDTGDGLLRTWP